jgi:hypothetical protein
MNNRNHLLLDEHGSPMPLLVCVEYVRQSGKYNMVWPLEEARRAMDAILAVGVLLGQALDLDAILRNPKWYSNALTLYQDAGLNKAALAAAAAVLPGGSHYRTAAVSRRTAAQIIDEAVTACQGWTADGNIGRGAQLLQLMMAAAPPPRPEDIMSLPLFPLRNLLYVKQ